MDYAPYIGYLGTIVMGGLYAYRFFTEGKDKISADTIKRYEDSVNSFEVESKRQKEDNQKLSDRIKELTATVETQSERIKTLEAVITAKAEIQQIQTSLQKFEFIIPMMAQFQSNDTQTHNDLQEIRAMIRESRGITQRAIDDRRTSPDTVVAQEAK